MPDLNRILSATAPLTLASVARGAQPLVLADLARAAAAKPSAGRTVFIAADDAAMRAVTESAAFFAPELPLLRDMVSGFDVKPWHGLMAPAGTPPAIVNKISEEVQAFLRTPPAMARLQALGVIRVGNSAAEFQSFMGSEFELYKKIIQDAGIKAE